MVWNRLVERLTHDVDAVVLLPKEKWKVFELVRLVAEYFSWPEDWLNDDIEIYIGDDIICHRLFQAPGIKVYAPEIAQMLALKLSAARSEVDLMDATNLLKQMSGNRHEIWKGWRRL
jgi:hypothetical protein